MDSPLQSANNSSLGRIFLITLLIPIVLLAVAARFNFGSTENELTANVISSAFALLCWGIAGWLLFIRLFSLRLFLILSALILVKILANFFHFYYVFSPLAGINSSGDLSGANFTGDLGPIYDSAIMFIDAFKEGGLLYAIIGDYYRGINNPGVAIIFGGLMSVFGEYGSIAIPWTVVYSAFASLLIGLIGLSMKLQERLCKVAIILVFFMPGFFIFPPLYRDNYIIFLLALSAYTAILLPRGNVFWISLALLLESILLFSLRLVYLILPPLFSIIAIYFNTQLKRRLTKGNIALGFVLFAAIIVGWRYLSPYIVFFYEGVGAISKIEQIEFSTLLASFKALGPIFFYPAAVIFSFLAPMPWWQPGPPALLCYQIFTYAQVWYGLTAIVALFFSYRQKLMLIEGSLLVVFSLAIFSLAFLGSINLAAGYIQIILPFLILASIKFLHINWKKCFLISSLIVALVHIVILIH